MNVNKLIIASFVGTALMSTSPEAMANSLASPQNAKAPTIASPAKNSNTKTVSGMSNHFDRQMGKTTFQWANINQAKPDMSAVAKEHQLVVAADFYLNQLIGKSANKTSIVKPV